MDELISKRAVIEAIEKARANVGHNLERSIGKSIIEILDDVGRDVDRLPSAHGTNLASLGTDCISRQAAIDALRKMQTYKMFSGDDMLLIDQAGAMTELMLLPPAEPKRETATVSVGKSKGGVTMWYECAACGEPVDQGDTFCSGCGRRLIHE